MSDRDSLPGKPSALDVSFGDRPTVGRRSRSSYKRPFDLAVLIVAHVALLAVWLLLWTVIPLVIWLQDRGPVFFRQRRILVFAHVPLAPVWALLWILVPLLVWLDHEGPLFFVQLRVGTGGRHFDLNKFRSMRDRTVSRAVSRVAGWPSPGSESSGARLCETACV